MRMTDRSSHERMFDLSAETRAHNGKVVHFGHNVP